MVLFDFLFYCFYKTILKYKRKQVEENEEYLAIIVLSVFYTNVVGGIFAILFNLFFVDGKLNSQYLLFPLIILLSLLFYLIRKAMVRRYVTRNNLQVILENYESSIATKYYALISILFILLSFTFMINLDVILRSIKRV